MRLLTGKGSYATWQALRQCQSVSDAPTGYVATPDSRGSGENSRGQNLDGICAIMKRPEGCGRERHEWSGD